MDNNRIKYLLEKHIADTISSIELDELFSLLEETDLKRQEEILADIFDGGLFEHKLSANRKHFLYDKVYQTVLNSQFNTKTVPLSRNNFSSFKKYISIAAILLMGLSTLLLWRKSESSLDLFGISDRLAKTTLYDIYLNSDSVPYLQLPNGETKFLDEKQSNALTDIGVKLSEGKSGEIIYQLQHHIDKQASLEQHSFIFSTPKGKSSKVVLVDGTQVWLNSGSSLEYPLFFSETERKVKLIGEAYFDVARLTEKPFYVETNHGPEIRVLGTAFNVSAYQEDKLATITLIEGSVLLSGKNHEIILKPSEQVGANVNDLVLKKERVNIDDFISWKEGYFSFNGQSIPEILTKIQRWYNIEDINYAYLPNDKFTGTFKRTKSLKSLLLKLEKISRAKFQIEEGRVTVMR